VTDLVPIAFAALAASAMLQPTPADRLRAAIGLPAFLVGAASLPRLPDFRGPSLAVWISAALLLLGPAVLAGSIWRARSRLTRRAFGAWTAVPAVALALPAAWPTLARGGVLPTLVTTAALAMAALLAWLLADAVHLGPAVRWIDARLAPNAWRATAERALGGAAAWVVTAALVAGTLGASVLLGSAALAPQAEVALAAVAGVAAAAACGLWPAQRLLPVGPLALLGGALLLRLGWSASPLGMEHWQPVGVGLGVLSAWWAVATRRPALALAGAGFAASFAGPGVAPAAGVLLLTAALAPKLPARVVALGAALGAFIATPALLGAEVVFTVLLAGGAAALLAALADPAAEPG
jgi:hypothetical protein